MLAAMTPERATIAVASQGSFTALAYPAAAPRAGVTLILGHGAGAGQTSGFMVAFATALSARGLDTLTFNFLYTEEHRRVPDPKEKLEACYRAVIDHVRRHPGFSANRLAIGGKSMGGRIASQIAAEGAGDLLGLVFLGYPLHPPGKPQQLRDRHLPAIAAPMLFLQGARDAFGTPEELRPILARLRAPAEIYVVAGGDHSFKVPKSAGIAQAEVFAAMQAKIEAWLRAAAARQTVSNPS
jgi:predicted alpha/beta-hydrolase family hydrolase